LAKYNMDTRLRVEQPSVLNKFFFQNYNILPHSGVRAESLHVLWLKWECCENVKVKTRGKRQ